MVKWVALVVGGSSIGTLARLAFARGQAGYFMHLSQMVTV